MTKIRKCNRSGHKPTDSILKPTVLADGYNYVVISDNFGKPTVKRVDELVAEAFIKGYKPGMEIIHIDGNKTNDRLDNLRIAELSVSK